MRALIYSLLLCTAVNIHAANGQENDKPPDDAILILDASGSMWGQIDGVNKIVIAKDVVESLVRQLPDDQRLGMVAYGHRREGDCKDIETLADIGATRDDVIKQLRGLTARGKTPLSASVQHAAEALNYRRNAATVILVSDGLENCAADPCELARVLEENGLDFTVHVIGFDVTVEERKGLECIAAETGGEFLAADDADELTRALIQVAAGPPSAPNPAAPVPSTLVLKATILSGGPQIQSQLDWSVSAVEGGDPVFTAANTGTAETTILPGDYVVEVIWRGWRDGSEKHGRAAFSVMPQQPRVLTLPVDLGLPVSLDTPDSTAEGVAVDVVWSGPDDLGANISVNRLDDAPNVRIFFFQTQKARGQFERSAAAPADVDSDGDGDFDHDDLATSTLAVPTIPGEYEIRYSLNRPNVILARRSLTVTDTVYTLAAPESLPVSTAIDIAWTGASTPGDLITIVPAGDTRAFDNGLYKGVKEGAPVSLTTPKDPGDYEIRYVMHGGYTTYDGMQHAVQMSVPLRVTDVSAKLVAPATAVGGSTIEIEWQGPADDWQDDFISVTAVGETRYNRKSWARIADRRTREAINPAPIRVPAIAGDYEVVYAISPGDRIISRMPITITMAEATVTAPASVAAGADFQVQYSGDGFAGDRVVLARADVPDDKMWGYGVNYGFSVSADGADGVIGGRLTAKPGLYEVRYVTGLQHQVLARAVITVE